ncbi:hypothetical protein [Streptomyces olivaceoviridis]
MVAGDGQPADGAGAHDRGVGVLEDCAADRHVAVRGVSGVADGVGRCDEDRGSGGTQEGVVPDGEVGDRPRLVPLLGVGGDVDAGHGHAVEEVAFDDDRPPGGHQDPAGGHVDEVVADDVDRRRGGDVLGDPVLRCDGGGQRAVRVPSREPRRPYRGDV